jgi:formylglycine-generating enzyme required for sulfatase activity
MTATTDGGRRPRLRDGAGKTASLIVAIVVVGLRVTCHAQGGISAAWPFNADEARERQTEAAQQLGVPVEREVAIGEDTTVNLVLVAPGEFVMGAAEDESALDPDESPTARVRIEKAFWLGKLEVTNGQYHCFDPAHDSGWIDTHGKDRVGPGRPLNGDAQPVCRLSWHDAQRFCAWLSGLIGAACRLPTEAEWEYACRAATETPWYSGVEEELPKYANFADASLGYLKPWAVRDNRYNDGGIASAAVGSYRPNGWGLHDMHGNVAEGCGSAYRPYPYDPGDGREDPGGDEPRTVRGGSWDDVPRRVRSAFRLKYDPTLAVYNVGFRVLVEVE